MDIVESAIVVAKTTFPSRGLGRYSLLTALFKTLDGYTIDTPSAELGPWLI